MLSSFARTSMNTTSSTLFALHSFTLTLSTPSTAWIASIILNNVNSDPKVCNENDPICKLIASSTGYVVILVTDCPKLFIFVL